MDVADQAGRHLDGARLQRDPELLDEQDLILGSDGDDDRGQPARMGAFGVFPVVAHQHALVAAFVDDARGAGTGVVVHARLC